MMTWRAGPGMGPDGLTWQRTDVARGTTAPLRRGTEATWQDACGPRVTQVTRVAEYRGDKGQLIGESSSLFNRILPLYFFRVGLCSHTVSILQDAWRCEDRWIPAERR